MFSDETLTKTLPKVVAINVVANAAAVVGLYAGLSVVGKIMENKDKKKKTEES